MELEKLEARLRREKRRQQQEKKGKWRRITGAALLLLLGAGFLWAFLWGPWRNREPQLAEAAFPAEEMPGETARIQLIDVGQGLGILIESAGEAMLIDGGGGQASSKTVAVLKNRGITRLNYILITHYDEDHMGGALGALAQFGADRVLGPDYEEDSRSFRSLTRRLQEAGSQIYHPAPGESFPLGNCHFTVLGPTRTYEVENDNSLMLRLTDGRYSILITGDAQQAAEEDAARLLGEALRSHILVVGHHGSYTSSGTAFLKAVRPAYLLLSCGAGNEYGHPHEAALKRLAATGARLWRTDQQGDIRLAFTESGILWEQAPAAPSGK